MKRSVVIHTAILLFPVLLSAQFMPSYKTDYASRKSFFNMSGSYSLLSNCITNEFAEKFYRKGYISDDIKSGVKDKLNLKNRIGAEISYGLNWYYKPDTLFGSPNLGVLLGVKNTQLFNASFSSDFFNVGFYGNKSYAGKTAYMGGLTINSLSYQQFSFGVLWLGLDTGRAKIGLVGSVMKGEKLYSIAASKADLYTSPTGEYINFTTMATLKRSDTASSGMAALNGYGGGCGLFFEAPYKLRRSQGVISISIRDVGVIYWNTKSQYVERDTSFYFDGFSVNNLFDLADSTFSSSAPDSIQNKVLPFRNKSFMITVPSTMEITTCTKYGKFKFIKGFRKTFNANSKEYFFLEGDYRFSKHMGVLLHLGYGGYAKAQVGLQVNVMLGETFSLTAGTHYAQGFVLKKATGQSAYVSMVKYF